MHGDTYHVKLVDNYQLTKRSDDAVFPSNTEAHLAIYRDSDTTVVKDLYGNTASECGFDKMTQPLEKRYNPLDIVPPGMDHTDLFKNKYRAIGNTLMKRAPAGCPASKKSKLHKNGERGE
jgi:hypothetical protein